MRETASCSKRAAWEEMQDFKNALYPNKKPGEIEFTGPLRTCIGDAGPTARISNAAIN
ncbi:hypothetical protein QO004_002084 [Rhizobium mesoamericanum]|nr:hypothetical protein [Rhizobium mesoamericanum]